MRTFKPLTATILAVLLAGCAATAPISPQDAATQAKLLQFAGPPIDSFTYLGHYDGFRTLGEKQVVLFTTINDGYLIRVRAGCRNLRYVNRFGLTSSDRTVNRVFDFVLADQQRCPIDTIRHIDYGAFKRARDTGTS
ncbi:MAG TPA: DUF6491 family protein [Steroidobacteraceae bacterium]|jgi:hypothetical protein|nr:DUF6491 family protein [Steroidobacteraceae bacterium]